MSASLLRRRVALCLLPAALYLFLAGQVAGGGPAGKKLNDKVKEIAGSAEFLRSVPKHFATLKAVDVLGHKVTLLIEGEVLPKVWPLVPDAEIKVLGWWGRLDQFKLGDRVWVWFKTDRKKQPVAISMLADEISEQDIHGPGVTVAALGDGTVTLRHVSGPDRVVKIEKEPKKRRRMVLLGEGREELKTGEKVYVQSAGGQVRLLFSSAVFEKNRKGQQHQLRERWAEAGLPGTAAFIHVFSGEMDFMLDHEAMRWGRSLKPGDAVSLQSWPVPGRVYVKPGPPPHVPANFVKPEWTFVKAVVKSVQPWRERTQVRLVVHSFDLADLSVGQRLHLVRTPPPADVDESPLPPDLDQPRTKQERVEWFLASIYCTCQVKGDRCTGHFYTLASCNPNGCGMPNQMRRTLADKIERGLTDRQIFEELLKEHGPLLLRPHLLP